MTVLRGGLLVDGTGAPPRPADVAIDGDRIAAVEAPGTVSGDGDVVDLGRKRSPNGGPSSASISSDARGSVPRGCHIQPRSPSLPSTYLSPDALRYRPPGAMRSVAFPEL
jgi:hypothetical protein